MTYANVRIGRRNLILPSGRMADDMRWHPLFIELTRLKVPNIKAEDGKEVLLDRYEAYRDAIVDEMPRAGMKPTSVSEALARQAAAIIEERAR